MWVAAVELWAAVCIGVAQATCGCAAGAAGARWSASEVEGVVTGCPVTSTLVYVSSLTASG